MKHSLQYITRYCLAVLVCAAFTNTVSAQTETDALMIPKNYFCAAGVYTHNSWDHYWEGTFKRDNANLGTVSSNIYAVGGNYGLSNRVNLLFMIPYIKSNASAGTLRGQRGVQDINLAVKWMAVKQEIGTGLFSVHAILSGSIPLNNYEADFLPLSLGMQSKSIALRGLVNYQVGRFFIAGAGQFVRKDNVTIDRDAYYTTEMHYTNQVAMPNVTNFLVSSGYRSLRFNAEAVLTKMTSTSGFDITKNNMPFISNKMNALAAGAVFKYSFSKLEGLELTAGGNYVLQGRNYGQNTSFFGGVYYVFSVKKDKSEK
ncbi:transporter [Mucilaginibacter terrigena]|nr:transporter [Mucilaginibacter terrigena]